METDVAPLVWDDWVRRYQDTPHNDAAALAACIIEGLQMVSTCPWACAMPLLRLVICDRAGPCFARLWKALPRQLYDLLRDFMLEEAETETTEADACFCWHEKGTTHLACIDQMGRPELGLVLWNHLSVACDHPDQFPHVEWVVQAFDASRATALMIPTVWVAMNLLARMRHNAGVSVPLHVVSHLMANKRDRMHYLDLSDLGETLLLEWLDAERRGECPHAGKLRFSKDSQWTRRDEIQPRLIARAKSFTALLGPSTPQPPPMRRV